MIKKEPDHLDYLFPTPPMLLRTPPHGCVTHLLCEEICMIPHENGHTQFGRAPQLRRGLMACAWVHKNTQV